MINALGGAAIKVSEDKEIVTYSYTAHDLNKKIISQNGKITIRKENVSSKVMDQIKNKTIKIELCKITVNKQGELFDDISFKLICKIINDLKMTSVFPKVVTIHY